MKSRSFQSLVELNTLKKKCKPLSANGGIAISRRSPASGMVILIAAFVNFRYCMNLCQNKFTYGYVPARLNNEVTSIHPISTIYIPSLLSSLTTI